MNANGAFWACGVGGIDRRVRPIPRVAVSTLDLRELVRRAMFPTLFSDKGERVSQALDVGIEAVMETSIFCRRANAFSVSGRVSSLGMAAPSTRTGIAEYCE